MVSMSVMLKQAGLSSLRFCRKQFLTLLDDVPADKLTHQPFPGANHALWITGHLLCSDDEFLTEFKPRPSRLSEAWQKLFGSGSRPVDDPAAYPSLAEIREQMTPMREELYAWFEGMSDEQLATPLPGNWARFAENFGAMMGSIVWHEGLHSGQLTSIRRSLGMGPKFSA